jgi:predicted nucleotidyltransferase
MRVKRSKYTLNSDILNMTPKNIEEAVCKFSETITELYGDKIAEMYLYGSVARGDYKDDSDIDMFITMNAEKSELNRIHMKICKIISDIDLDHNIILSCMVSTKQDFDNDIEYLYVNIKKDGVKIV